jgi:hypothetical protein
MEEKRHQKLGATIRLKAAEELTQGDFDRFYATYDDLLAKLIKGAGEPEENSRTLRSALAAGWIEWIKSPDGEVRTADQVDGLKRAIARWCAQLVDAEFKKANDVPNE